MNQLIEKIIAPFFRRHQFAQPILSLTWGIASGFAMSRDFQHTTRLVLFAFGIVLFTIIISLWTRWVRKNRDDTHDIGYFRNKIGKSLLKRSQMIDWIGITATQLYVQYILMFCLPFLFMGRHWISLCISIACLIPNLWDPWWQQLSKHFIPSKLILLWTLILSVSFLYCLFFPQHLDRFYYTVGLISCVYSFPYGIFSRPPNKPWYISIFPFLIVMIVICLHRMSPIKLPNISIWTKDARFSLTRANNKNEDYLTELNLTPLGQDETLCCITPVVAPGVVNAFVSHKWYLDSDLIEEITLPRLRNIETKTAAPWEKTYRTMSCKKSFPNFAGKNKLTCRIYLNHSLLIGNVNLKLQQ